MAPDQEDYEERLKTTPRDPDGVLSMDVFKGAFDVPFEWPGKQYNKEMRPWIQPNQPNMG